MSKTKENNVSEDKLATFVSSAIRSPKAGAYEQLLSQFLASAVVVTDPLKRVKIVCEAALMIPEDEREDLAIDYDKIEKLNAVANAMLNRSKRTVQDLTVVGIPWGFALTKKNFEKYIKAWFQGVGSYWPFLMRKHVEIGRTIFGNPDPFNVKKITKNPFWSFFFEASHCLTAEGFNSLKNSFSAYAIPIVQTYLAQLTRVVSPGLYSQIIGLYTRRGKSYSQKVKETAEIQKEDEGILGSRL